MYDTILVGTDGSISANRAIVHALDLAEQYDATLHAIYVVDTSMYSEPALGSSELATNKIEEIGHQYLDEIEHRADDLSVDFARSCCHGKPYEAIVRYADDVDADLIVLGYHGRSHADSPLLGSVSDRVVRRSGRPTLII